MKAAWSLSLATLLYVFVGYPALMALMVRLRGIRPIRRDHALRRVSFVISAYNEAGVIRQKLENTLQLDYPRDLLEVVVVSDASTDETDEFVAAFAARGVKLKRLDVRLGKTAGLNRTVPELDGDLVVFSDANAMYEPGALRALVRNFADPDVGCVTGEARYVNGDHTAADVGERLYWNYEIQLKHLETAVGSTVGGDGAIYAIRKHLWRTLPQSAINDFLNPLQIVAAGWRAVYEPEAVCFEETAASIGREYRRRVRIISRSWRAIFQVPAIFNPFRVGFFTISVISHKLLRWLTAVFLGISAGVPGVLLVKAGLQTEIELMFGATALVIAGVCGLRSVRPTIMLAVYFAIINIASLVGVLNGTFGRVSATWSTVRERHSTGRDPVPAPRAGGLRAVTTTTLLLGAGAALTVLCLSRRTTAAWLFWGAGAVLAFVYVGYPLMLALLGRLIPRPIIKAPIEPCVCLFIAAHNEQAVIAAKLRNSLALDYPVDRLDIVVASDGSTDGTNAIVRSFVGDRVRMLEYPERRGKIAVINAGVPALASEIVVFSDANTLLEPDAIRTLVRSFADPRVGVVSGDVVLVGERASLGVSEDLYYRYERWLQRVESEIGSMIGVDGALYALRRRLFRPPPNETILDDLAIPMTAVLAGYRAVFEPSARAFEQGSRSAREEFARKARIVAGAVQFLTHLGPSMVSGNLQVRFGLISHKVLRWLSPGFGAAAFAASLVLASQSTFYLVVAGIQLAFLGAGLAGCVLRLRHLKPIGLAHYFLLVHAAAAVGFVRGLMRRQPTAWRRFPRVPLETA